MPLRTYIYHWVLRGWPNGYDRYRRYLLGTTPPNVEQYYTKEYAVQHDMQSGEWWIPHKDRFRLSYLRGKYEKQNYQEWGTKRMDMLTLLEKVLNMRTVSIKDACDDNNPKKYVINHGETIKILEKQDKMIAEFKDWVWKHEGRRKRLQSAYCRTYGNIRKRHFDFLRNSHVHPSELNYIGFSFLRQ